LGRRTRVKTSAPRDSRQRRVPVDPREARSWGLILVAPSRFGYNGRMWAVGTARGYRQRRGWAALVGCGLASATTLGLQRAAAQESQGQSQPIQSRATAQVLAPRLPAQQLPTQPALGPFTSLQAYCASVERSGAGRCDASLNDFAPGWQRAERGPFLSATRATPRLRSS
jgi:hypothetical protein